MGNTSAYACTCYPSRKVKGSLKREKVALYLLPHRWVVFADGEQMATMNSKMVANALQHVAIINITQNRKDWGKKSDMAASLIESPCCSGYRFLFAG